MAKIDLRGQIFERLTVIEEVGRNNRNEVLWKCRCSCGNYTNVTTYRLRKGSTKSCGCLNIDTTRRKTAQIGKANITHNMSNTRIYKTYRNIIDRCYNPKSKKYVDYGARGIHLSEEWNTFENFYEWSKNNGYEEHLTIDRIDVNGNYEPSNCRWVDMNIQNNNRRTNRILELNGIKKTLSQWANEYNLKAGTLSARIDRYGFSLEDALTMSESECRAINKGKKIKITNIETNEVLSFNSLKDAYETIGGNYSTIRYAYQKNKLYLKKYKIEND